MNPCPTCKSYNLRAQTPVDLRDPNRERMLGYCYIKCFDCGHKGPEVKTGNMTRTQAGKSEELAKLMFEAWNFESKVCGESQ